MNEPVRICSSLLRELGHSHPLMSDIERPYAENGWTTKPGNTATFDKIMVAGDESVFIQTHPDDIRAGDLLAKRGDLDEALIVYRRSLDKWTAELAKNPHSNECRETIRDASERLEKMT